MNEPRSYIINWAQNNKYHEFYANILILNLQFLFQSIISRQPESFCWEYRHTYQTLHKTIGTDITMLQTLPTRATASNLFNFENRMCMDGCWLLMNLLDALCGVSGEEITRRSTDRYCGRSTDLLVCFGCELVQLFCQLENHFCVSKYFDKLDYVRPFERCLWQFYVWSFGMWTVE